MLPTFQPFLLYHPQWNNTPGVRQRWTGSFKQQHRKMASHQERESTVRGMCIYMCMVVCVYTGPSLCAHTECGKESRPRSASSASQCALQPLQHPKALLDTGGLLTKLSTQGFSPFIWALKCSGYCTMCFAHITLFAHATTLESGSVSPTS